MWVSKTQVYKTRNLLKMSFSEFFPACTAIDNMLDLTLKKSWLPSRNKLFLTLLYINRDLDSCIQKAHLFHDHLRRSEANLNRPLDNRMNKFLHSSLNSWAHKLLEMRVLLEQRDLQGGNRTSFKHAQPCLFVCLSHYNFNNPLHNIFKQNVLSAVSVL